MKADEITIALPSVMRRTHARRCGFAVYLYLVPDVVPFLFG
jgi:hypothetical protein